ncbi:unnamed protein product [Macrosiphum euphorbiae]|uniref:Uncharacterized protein n=1 Tax=Macrosiphum euphorbiae TaxID=13131 RepID=A0AAV0VX22_9HEMI|nr:unnamed protein product [Macrosiphum euphorbiae]
MDYFSIVFNDDGGGDDNNNNSTAEQNNERGVNCSGSCCSRMRVYRSLGEKAFAQEVGICICPGRATTSIEGDLSYICSV